MTHHPVQPRHDNSLSSRPVERPDQDQPAQNRTGQQQRTGNTPQDQEAAHTTSTAPAPPSTRDPGVAAQATRLESSTHTESREAAQAEHESTATDTAESRGNFDLNRTRPASVGELLDVIA